MKKYIFILGLFMTACYSQKIPLNYFHCSYVVVEEKNFSPLEGKSNYVCKCLKDTSIYLNIEERCDRANVNDTVKIRYIGDKLYFSTL